MSHDFPDGPDYNPEPIEDDPWNVDTTSYPQEDAPMMWHAHYQHPDGQTYTAEIKANSYTAAKVCARNGEEDGFLLVRVVRS